MAIFSSRGSSNALRLGGFGVALAIPLIALPSLSKTIEGVLQINETPLQFEDLQVLDIPIPDLDFDSVNLLILICIIGFYKQIAKQNLYN